MMICRYLRIDRRLEDEEILKDAHAVNFDEDFYVYRDCLYAYFIKFPTSFVIRAHKRGIDGDVKHIFVHETKHDFLKTRYFITTFDTRKCDWFKNVELDTEEDTIYLQERHLILITIKRFI